MWFRNELSSLAEVSLYCHLWPAWPYNSFPHYLINDTSIGKKLLKTKCVFSLALQRLYGTFLTLRRTVPGMTTHIYWSSGKVAVILVKVYWSLNFLHRSSKITQISNFMKSVQWEASCSMWTDRYTDGRRELKKMHNEELYEMYTNVHQCTTNVIQVVKSRRTRRMGYVTRRRLCWTTSRKDMIWKMRG